MGEFEAHSDYWYSRVKKDVEDQGERIDLYRVISSFQNKLEEAKKEFRRHRSLRSIN